MEIETQKMVVTVEDRSEIAFFDLETTWPGQGSSILEFGAILVCPRKLVELRSYSSLVRPADLSHISSLARSNGITEEAIVSAPSFADIADTVYDFLHGRIWAGHNIVQFDWARITEAFAEINRPAPEPKGTIDSLALLTQKFGKRAGDMKMATLATYFGLGRQMHRSLDDVRMNLEVIKRCATVLFLESILPDVFTENSWVSSNAGGCDDFLLPNNISLPLMSINLVPLHRGLHRILISYPNFPMQLQCASLKVRFGISTKFVDHAGLPRLSFVVDAPSSLCNVLDEADRRAQKLSVDSGSSSEWRCVVTRKQGFFPTIRLHVPTLTDGETSRWTTEIYQKDSSATPQKLMFSRFDVKELRSLLTPGNIIDAYFSLDTYDYQQNAGIRLVAKKMVVYSS